MAGRLMRLVGAAMIVAALPSVAQQAAAPVPSGSALAKSLSIAFADVYEKVSPSVVVIEVESRAGPISRSLPPGLRFFFQDEEGGVTPFDGEIPPNQGSGVIITQDGYILTNNHVIEEGEGRRERVRVLLHDGREFDAKVIGIDSYTDLAVLKVDASGLPVAELGDSDAVRVGEFAFALGAPFELRDTFTFGVIGAKGRTDLTRNNGYYEEFIQTDASINPGNSGGPLCDINGRVIGINTLIRGQNRGLGFAIPINIAKGVAAQLIANGRTARPWLGIGIVGIDEIKKRRAGWRAPDQAQAAALEQIASRVENGVVVSEIRPDTPADRSDLKELDVIVRVDGKPVRTARELQKAILARKVGDEVRVEVWRDGRTRDVRIRLGDLENSVMRASNSASRNNRGPFPPPSSSDPLAGLEVKTLNSDLAAAVGSDETSGVVVSAVAAESAASRAGIREGDVITAVGEKPVKDADEFAAAVRDADPAGVMLHISRGKQRTFAILRP